MDWFVNARCRAVEDPDLFFPDTRSDVRYVNNHQVAKARAICGQCPVSMQCLEYALKMEASGEYLRAGIYGGYTPAQRQQLAEGRLAS